MATPQAVQQLRRLIAEPDDSNGWDDTRLSELLDEEDATVYSAASQAWTQKAAEAATLVDVSESGSSRKLGDVRKNALEMAAHYSSLGGGGSDVASGPIIQRIRRTLP